MIIYKFRASIGAFPLELRRGAKFLSCHVQNEVPCLWFLVDTKEPVETRHFHGYMTGESTPENPGQFLGTAMLDVGTFVLHFFEVRP